MVFALTSGILGAHFSFMKFILGTKKGMTQVFDADGVVHPVTVLALEKTVVTQVKNKETDGYTAVQVGYGEQKEFRINKAQKPKGNVRGLKEFRMDDVSAFTVGNEVLATDFKEGEKVQVSAISKGKGFQGVVKRHGFSGGPRSHGQKHSERERGSSGGGPGRAGGRVVKGMKMAGRMGGDRITVPNLTVIRVDVEKGELLIEGAVPGRRGTLVEIVSK
jgi:large subunit ribosomal protein L3